LSLENRGFILTPQAKSAQQVSHFYPRSVHGLATFGSFPLFHRPIGQPLLVRPLRVVGDHRQGLVAGDGHDLVRLTPDLGHATAAFLQRPCTLYPSIPIWRKTLRKALESELAM
jgi:hypothetical protein